VAALIQACMAEAPEDRPSAREIAAALATADASLERIQSKMGRSASEPARVVVRGAWWNDY
jgi:hypothetical protein